MHVCISCVPVSVGVYVYVCVCVGMWCMCFCVCVYDLCFRMCLFVCVCVCIWCVSMLVCVYVYMWCVYECVSNCQRSKSAIFLSRNINYNINSLLR